MSFMSNVTSTVERVISPIAYKVSTQPHINAVKDGFVATMPFLIVGSLLLVLAFPPGTSNAFLQGWQALIDTIGQGNILSGFQVSMGIFALYAAFGIGFNLAEHYKLRALNSGMLSMFVFLLAVAPVEFIPEHGGIMPIAFMGGTGAFTAIVCGLLVPECQRLLLKYNIRLKLPEAVPPKISASFDLLIPIVLLTIIVVSMNVVLGQYDLNIPKSVMAVFKPIVAVSDSFFACLLAVVMIQLLWFAGIHGSQVVVVGILYPILLVNLGLNQDALAAGLEIPKIFVNPILDFFIFVGGAGGTLGLVILMMRSKATHLKTIGRMSIIPGCFNINEPVIFGTPIVMNVSYFIPWLLSPVINTCIVWLAFKTDFIPKVVALPPWTMPAPIGAVMATNSIMAASVVIVCVLVSMAIFFPFFKAHEKQLLIEEQSKSNVTESAVATVS
ncbi:PTS transporter subunit EIIC [Vibrio mediterranei]|jgi:PTS system cellobiose-specific IIC component|uniref:PTS sugar transporter subunit IIC n=1 Tax=Vibrio mediterranei TaxID=689 RepID=UPI001EFD32C5|nr:PTS transporter subunit EIIC [Vibrio mediterranei]MCG9627752.1 PTS transporter subunit EIIC [Vibrio mediterranei]MCY9855093.1 PTS transporter subunit EIIC [Vibrio mediterranei]